MEFARPRDSKTRTDVELSSIGPVAAQVIQPRTGLFGALLLEGPDAGRWWALDGQWTVGQRISVRYYPEDQFAQIVPDRSGSRWGSIRSAHRI